MSADQQLPKVSILIVSFNTREMTLACIRSVQAETRTPAEIIVIDNASGDGSAEAIAAEFPDVVLMAERENHGFALANNVAARRATGEYLLLLNPDTVIMNGAIDKLVAFAEKNPDARIWGGRTLYGDGSLNRTSCFQKMSLWNVFCRATGLTSLTGNNQYFSEAYGNWNVDSVRQVDIITGCFFLLPLKLWRDLGGFNPTYFMYGEEADLCLRAERDWAALPMITPEAEIIHYGGASEPVRADKVVRQYNAKLTLIRHHFPDWQKGIAMWLFRSIPLTRGFLMRSVAAVTGKPEHLKAAEAWRQVWKRRVEWRNGFAEKATLPVEQS